MLTYYTVYISLLTSSLLGRYSQSIRKLLYWAILIFLTLFVGFRDDVGCDFNVYQAHYLLGYEISLFRATYASDPAHWLLIALLNYLGLHSQSLNIVASVIFFIGIHSLAKRQPDPLAFLILCFPILIINMPMSATRQSIAIGFICLAFSSFIDKRRLAFIIFIILGFLFHSSAIIFILLFPFINKRFSIKSIFWSFVFLIPALLYLLSLESSEAATSKYLSGNEDAAGAIFRIGVLLLSGFYFYIFLSSNWRKFFPYDYKIVQIASLLMIFSIILIPVSSVIGDRFGYYLIPLQSMIFARIPYLNLRKYKIVHSLFPYFLLSLTFIVWTLISSFFTRCYIPYQYDFSL